MIEPIITDDKSGVLYRRWKHPEPRVVALLVHGLGGHSARWKFLAEYFLNKAISSYAIELKGFGETAGLKGHIDSFDIYLSDIRGLRDIIKKENSKKIFIIGESMGALISYVLAAKEPGLFDGLVCISPAFGNKMKFGILKSAVIFVSLLYDRKRQFTVPFNSAMCTRDVEYRNIMDKDPREHRLATPRLLLEIIKAQINSGRMGAEIKMPVLFQTAGKDVMVDPVLSRKIFARLTVKDKTIIDYPKMSHALPIDFGREVVFNDIITWMTDRI